MNWRDTLGSLDLYACIIWLTAEQMRELQAESELGPIPPGHVLQFWGRGLYTIRELGPEDDDDDTDDLPPLYLW